MERDDSQAIPRSPKDAERIWFRHRYDGQLGFLVQREGRDMIKLDRANEDICRPFNAIEWVPEHERRPMTEAQMAQIAFAADRQLCVFLGMHDKTKEQWLDLREEKRIAWMRQGPAHPEIRANVYRGIMDALRSYAGDE